MILQPLATWILRSWASTGPVRLLDFGCGDLLLADLLPSDCTVDGFDSDERARAAARHRIPESRGRIFEHVGDIPPGTYDGVILASVLQYVRTKSQLLEVLIAAARSLHPRGQGIIATDVVIGRSRSPRDVGDLVGALVPQIGLVGAATALHATILRSPSRAAGCPLAEFEDAAVLAGLSTTELPANLSPLRTRSSYLLRREPVDDDGTTAARGRAD